jgi:predicted nucleotidyltransferase
MNHEIALKRLQLLALTGSRAYGINNPDSDFDYKGVTIGLPNHYFGFDVFEQIDKGWEDYQSPEYPYLGRDTVIFEIRKFFRLATDGNPNILDLLFSPEYKLLTPVAEKILENRDLFLSKKCKHTFSGYAYSQYSKISSHRKWLLDPPKKEPHLEDFGLADNYRLSKTEMNSFLEYLYHLVRKRIEFAAEVEILEKYIVEVLQGNLDFKQVLMKTPLPDECIAYTQDLTGASDNYIRLLQSQHSYNTAKNHWDSYQQWKKGRNPERAILEAKCGFDSKCGAHLIRLMTMGCEILEGKGVIVDRRLSGDAEEIRYIRNGNMSYDDLLVKFEALKLKTEELYITSKLPNTPPRKQIEELCTEAIISSGLLI